MLKKFDRIINKKGYASGSEAIRDLIRSEDVKEALENDDAQIIGTITLLYSHATSNVMNKLLSVEHEHNKNIISTTHVHLDERNCLEVIVLDGKVKELRSLADELISIKGVKHGKLVLTKKSF
ncbi:MAG: nickel-responsive transcriptional regulator NikR [Candidatus Thermoplasmatota archaeon]|nr:nickel-responsive transcriptional regulator NikR [Candidatus Thermoplasmatota archaeon]